MIKFKNAFSCYFRPIMLGSSLLVLGSCLQACVIVQPKTPQIMPDNSIITGSIGGNSVNLPKVDLGGDEKVMREQIAAQPDSSIVNWKNDATGSRGTMSILNSFVENGSQCRSFKTTRESFNGIMIYQGKACQQNDTSWNVSQIKAL
ncbi:RT0821/Lpp0805 family surface protein [Bartonella sp. HY761]|uniref:RT0821/Lpp0805 family surface protein n=1 Tax=Bartonella sp. HY761 TaxID=2979330 RepID=UPI0022002212|nr:RT0821/Lpp0805 family surface protein [Bartonella sp. HY761]UXN06616.1 RT0821/Lpp0805 family surface protein [Bartonella sp. HY761]